MIASGKLQEAVLGAASEAEQEIIRRVAIAGQRMLFDQGTHKPVFDDMLKGDIAEGLGSGIAHIMLVLYDKSRKQPAQPSPSPAQAQPSPAQAQPAPGLIGAQQAPQAPPNASQPTPKSSATMPRGALLPASAIILSKAAEFVERAKLGTIDDSQFNQALQMAAVKITDRFDPSFRDKVASKTGKSAQPQATQPPPEQPAGLLNGRV